MKNRHLATAAVSAALVVTLAACSDNTDSTNTNASGGTGISGSLKASGSSAQKNAMAEWINAFQTENSGVTIDYQANGSGAGIQDFNNNQTSLAGSDAVMKSEEQTAADARCATGPAIHLPMVGGAIAVAYNVDGVDSLTLTPEVIAGIFNSDITKWNDEQIAALNPGVTLPDATIAQFHRSDESGTTQNFASYLSATAADTWTYEVSKAWPAPGGQGAKGSDGLSAALQQTPNSIGYVELSFVLDGGLKAASVDNGGGAVAPNADSAALAISSAQVVGSGNDVSLQLDPTIADGQAYPIVLVTYEITCQTGLPADQVAIVKPFLEYTSSAAGQDILEGIGYVPITGSVLTKVQAAVQAIS